MQGCFDIECSAVSFWFEVVVDSKSNQVVFDFK